MAVPLAGLALAIVGCSSTVASTGDRSLVGEIHLPGTGLSDGSCIAEDGYEDVAASTVLVFDESGDRVGHTIVSGVGEMEQSRYTDENGLPVGRCIYRFRADGLPAASFYQVQVGRRGKVRVDQANLERLILRLGGGG